MAIPTKRFFSCLIGSLFAPALAFAAEDITKVVDCSRGESIQRQIDKRNPDKTLTLLIRGTCAEDVTVDRDDLALVGEGATVNGTISIVGARRVLIRDLTVSSPGGAGIFGTENAAFRVENSTLERNLTNGLTVRNGAQATVRGGSFSQNGHATTLPDTGRGIEATHNGSVDVANSTITGNRSDGVGVFNGSYARLVENIIESNGRVAVGEAGIQVNRSRVRAGGNIIRNNTGSSAIIVVNSSDYRTGTGLNALELPDNEFAFERIEHPVGVQAGVTLIAVDVSNDSYGDFRQVHIVGTVNVGRQSMLQVRGDDIGANRTCSTITVPPGGFFSVSGRNGLARLLFVNVTPPVVGIGAPNGQLDGSPVCVVTP